MSKIVLQIALAVVTVCAAGVTVWAARITSGAALDTKETLQEAKAVRDELGEISEQAHKERTQDVSLIVVRILTWKIQWEALGRPIPEEKASEYFLDLSLALGRGRAAEFPETEKLRQALSSYTLEPAEGYDPGVAMKPVLAALESAMAEIRPHLPHTWRFEEGGDEGPNAAPPSNES